MQGFHGSIVSMIARTGLLDRLRAALARSPVAVLTRPRQCGKTTTARDTFHTPRTLLPARSRRL
jgi:predicted AAA+ superfamily ATPase